MKKQTQWGHPSRKTRSKASQEDNHSGQVDAIGNASIVSESNKEQMAGRKPKILWSKANDRESYRRLEEMVCKKMKAVNGST